MDRFYYRNTEGIRITVTPRYAPEHSDGSELRYVFVYHIRIENTSGRTAQLMWRHWYIHDDVAGDCEVQGEGVIGVQPVLEPGSVHEYESFCVLRGLSGHMEGHYLFEADDGAQLKIEIPRFQLNAMTAG